MSNNVGSKLSYDLWLLKMSNGMTESKGGAVNFVYHVIFREGPTLKSNCFVLPPFNTDPLFLNQ